MSSHRVLYACPHPPPPQVVGRVVDPDRRRGGYVAHFASDETARYDHDLCWQQREDKTLEQKGSGHVMRYMIDPQTIWSRALRTHVSTYLLLRFVLSTGSSTNLLK